MPIYLDDKLLVKRALAGEEEAFNQFFDDKFSRLYRFVPPRLSQDPDAAREVVHIAMSRALRKLHTYRAESSLFTWLCVICRNEMSDWLRKSLPYREHVVLTEDYPDIPALQAGVIVDHGNLSKSVWGWRRIHVQIALLPTGSRNTDGRHIPDDEIT